MIRWWRPSSTSSGPHNAASRLESSGGFRASDFSLEKWRTIVTELVDSSATCLRNFATTLMAFAVLPENSRSLMRRSSGASSARTSSPCRLSTRMTARVSFESWDFLIRPALTRLPTSAVTCAEATCRCRAIAVMPTGPCLCRYHVASSTENSAALRPTDFASARRSDCMPAAAANRSATNSRN